MKICVVTYHTSPLAAPGAGTAGGMNVFTARLYSHLSRYMSIDLFVHGKKGIRQLCKNVRVISLPDRALDGFAHRILDHHEQTHYDLVHTHYWLSGLTGQIVRARTSIPWIHSFHTIEHLKGITVDPHRIDAEHEIMKTCDMIISPTRRERLEILKVHPAARVLVIPHGVNTRAFRPSSNGHKRLLFVGRVTRIKGLDVLIDSLRYVKYDTELTVVGGPAQDRTTYANIRAYARGFPVQFSGMVPHHALFDYYRSASMVIMPSFYESFGLVALEAMSSARPVIGFNDTGLLETVGDTAGILVPRNERALARAITRLLHDDSLSAMLGAQGRARALRYDWRRIAAAYRAVYEAISKH